MNESTRRRGWRRFAVRLFILLVVCYALYGAAMLSFQDRLIFPRDVPGARNPALPVPAGWEAITVTGDDGSKVPAWLRLPESRRSGERAAVVMWFHGNAEVIDDLAHSDVVRVYEDMGVGVLLVEYRGYGRAGGSPSQAAITADSIKMYDLLAARPEIDPARIAYYGRSLGGGAACALAKERRPAAMILQSTFTSVRSMATAFLLPGFLVKHPFRNDEVIKSLDVPILFMHGEHDTIIPCSHSEALVKMARHGRLVTQACDHNDFPTDVGAYRETIGGFVRELGWMGR